MRGRSRGPARAISLPCGLRAVHCCVLPSALDPHQVTPVIGARPLSTLWSFIPLNTDHSAVYCRG